MHVSNSHVRDRSDAGSTTPVVMTLDEAHEDRVARLRTTVNGCIVMAVVTSTSVSAELIDQAISCMHPV